MPAVIQTLQEKTATNNTNGVEAGSVLLDSGGARRKFRLAIRIIRTTYRQILVVRAQKSKV
jgi:hypothetical protein